MSSEQLQIPRKELSRFLPDLRTITTFERLLDRVGTVIPADVTAIENDITILQGLLTYCIADAPIAKGTPVYVTGASSADKLIRCSPTPTGYLNTDTFIGIASDGALAGATLLIATAGEVQDIDTTGTPVGEVWAAGDALYYNPAYAGKLTNVAPSAPNQRTRLATVTSASATGSLNVHVVSAIVASQLVTTNSPSVGQGLGYSSSGMEWNNNAIYGMSSGAITGGVLSINTDTTKFDISDGLGYVVNPETSAYSKVTWTGLTGITPTHILTNNISYVALDSTGAVVQQATPFSGGIERDQINLGVLVHVDNVNINDVNNEQHVLTNPSNQLEDLLMAIGLFNRSGNVISANGVNVNIDRSAGILFGSGINYINSRKQPHEITIASATIQEFQYRMADGTNYTGVTQTAILPDLYDDLTSTPAAVPNNKFTNQHIFMFPSGNVKIQFGQTIYPTLDAAASGIPVEVFVTEPSIIDNGMLRAVLTVKKGCTDLSDTTEARFFMVDRFSASLQAQSAVLTSFDDNAFMVYDNTDPTKVVMLDASGITTGTTRTLTVPDFDGTIATLAGTETLTNKTITAPVISTISNTGTLTLPTSTDTLVGKATTDTLTNKTFDTAGVGNVLKINTTAVSAVTGTGAVVLANTPTLTTPNIGAATGTSLNVTGSLTCSQTTGLTGTTTNNDASAGYVGEYVTATSVPTAITSGAFTDLTSISLTEGDWDIGGTVAFTPAGTTVISQCVGSTSSTSATLGAFGEYFSLNTTTSAGAGSIFSTPTSRKPLAATTTIYLVAYAAFTVSTCNALGTIWARRRR